MRDTRPARSPILPSWTPASILMIASVGNQPWQPAESDDRDSRVPIRREGKFYVRSSDRLCDPLVRVRHRAWPRKVGGRQLRNVKSGFLNDSVVPALPPAT